MQIRKYVLTKEFNLKVFCEKLHAAPPAASNQFQNWKKIRYSGTALLSSARPGGRRKVVAHGNKIEGSRTTSGCQPLSTNNQWLSNVLNQQPVVVNCSQPTTANVFCRSRSNYAEESGNAKQQHPLRKKETSSDATLMNKVFKIFCLCSMSCSCWAVIRNAEHAPCYR